MTSLYPESTGIYFLSPDLAESDVAKKNTLHAQRFEEEGYQVTGAGKIFHGNQNKKYIPNYSGQLWRVWSPARKEDFLLCRSQIVGLGGVPRPRRRYAGPQDCGLGSQGTEKEPINPVSSPLDFTALMCPSMCPRKWFDLYPLESLQLPKVLEKDLDDLSEYGINLTRLNHVAPTQDWVKQSNEWKPLVQSYLACVSFVDHQVGKLLDALDSSPAKDNTVVVLYSDHGFHLGEKERWAKRSLWEDSTRVPLILPAQVWSVAKYALSPCNYWMSTPPFWRWQGSKKITNWRGNSLATLLQNPRAEWPNMARTSFGPGNYSIRSERYRYIHYNDGSEEFYDHSNDPHEWNNLIEKPELFSQIEEHRAHKPGQFHPVLGTVSTGHRAFHASEEARKQAKMFDSLDWERPVDNPVFTTTFGNNHDSVLFVDPELEYPYHLIISHTTKAAHLWRAKKFSWSSADWELVSDQYVIGKHYEYDDGVKVDGTYYLYEEGIVYTFTGPLEEASGKWKAAGTFPSKQCDDIGIYYEDGVFHMFGEHGHFPHGPDGTSLAHFSSTTGLGDWKLVNAKAVDPNPDGGHKYGVGDATIEKIGWRLLHLLRPRIQGQPLQGRGLEIQGH